MHTIAARTRADNELSLKSTVGGGDRTLTNKVARKQFLIVDATQFHVMLGYSMRKADCEYYFARPIGEAS